MEAIFDFRVKARAGFHPEEFAALKARLVERFPNVEERRGLQAIFEAVQGQARPPLVQDLGLQGYFYRTADGKTIAQFRVDGFTFNRLHPYTSWEELFPQAIELWQLYTSVSRPDVVTRLAVRYINRIELPPGAVAFENYLRAAPVIPRELPQYVSSFLTRVTIHDPEINIDAHVAQALEASALGDSLVVILDIDAYKQSEFSINAPTIPKTLEQLRVFKNRIFFNSLTEDKLREFE